MRFNEIKEGIRMGARDLSAVNLNDLTIGFEFEVAVNDAVGIDNTEIDMGDVDIDSAFDEFTYNWFNGESTFDFEDWFNDEFTRSKSFHDIILDYDYEPLYGWAEDGDQLLEYLNKNAQKEYSEKVEKYGEKAFEEARKLESDIQNYYDGDINKFLESDFNNVKRVIFVAYRYFYLRSATMTDDEFDRWFNEIIEDTTENRLKEVAKKDYMNWLKKFSKMPQEYDKDSEEYLDFDPDDQFYFYDKNGNILHVENDLILLDDLLEYFAVDMNEIKDDTKPEWEEANNELMMEEFNTWLQNNAARFVEGSGGGAFGYIKNKLDEELDDGSKWIVKDESTPDVDAEIISPVYGIETGIKKMNQVLSLIKDDDNIFTNTGCGLHINIGTWRRNEIDEVDWLKFLVVYRAERVLKDFSREYNKYARDRMPDILRGYLDQDLTEFYKDLSEINRRVIRMSEKMSSINLSKLYNHGIIEIRAPGGTGYENRAEYLTNEIKRALRALKIASDIDAYKREYTIKLYKLLSQQKDKLYGKDSDIVHRFIKEIGGYRAVYSNNDLYKSFVRQVLRIPENINLQLADKKYNIRIHRSLVNRLKDQARANGIDNIADVIRSYRNPEDSYSVALYDTKFMKTLIRDLEKP